MSSARLCILLAAAALGHAAALGRWCAPPSARRVPPPLLAASRDTLPPVVILPGFGNADVDYKTPLGQPEVVGLVSVLRRRGFGDVSVLDLPRQDWFRVAGGLVDPRFWFGDQRPDSIAYGWYLQRARAAIEAASARAGGKRVLVIAHSAGGWLARAALADGEWPAAADTGVGDNTGDGNTGRGTAGAGNTGGGVTRARDVVAGLVTLGAPHFPPPAGSPPCATRGALAFCDTAHPGAYLKESHGLFYITVAGAAIKGRREVEREEEKKDTEGGSGWWATLGGRGGSLGGTVNGAGPPGGIGDSPAGIASPPAGITSGAGGGAGAGGGTAVAPSPGGIAVGREAGPPTGIAAAPQGTAVAFPPGIASEADALYARRGEGSAARVAFTNYLALGGDGGVMGDGVIPVGVAHLEGATQVRIPPLRHDC
jgi:pimeloyl-ACP methyl ester carboxylesterase